VVKYFRWILSIGLIYGVYREAGVVTSIVALLIFIKNEIDDYKKNRYNLELGRRIDKMS